MTKMPARAAIGLVGAMAALASACTSNDHSCAVTQGAWIMKYYPTASAPDGGPCLLPGEQVGVQQFLGTEHGAQSSGSILDTTVVLEPGQLATLAATGVDTTNSPFSSGSLAATPDSNNICKAAAMSASEQNVPGDSDAGTVSADVVYAWANVNILSGPQVLGAQLSADLTYTDNINSCTATYKAVGIYPVTACAGADGGPDIRFCNPVDAPDAGYVASGINPLFPLACDPVLLICVLQDDGTGTPPALPEVDGGWTSGVPEFQNE